MHNYIIECWGICKYLCINRIKNNEKVHPIISNLQCNCKQKQISKTRANI